MNKHIRAFLHNIDCISARLPPFVAKIIALVLMVVVIIFITRGYSALLLRQDTKDYAVTRVTTIVARYGNAMESFILPANVAAWHEATIYARTNGYIKKWYVDIGSRVKENDLLAEIETPEVDAQWRQAEADLKTAQANHDLAQVTMRRWLVLLKSDSVSRQDADDKVAAAKVAAAALAAAQANRDRLRDLVNFKRVLAPFDGVISSRTTDIGSLINAGRSTLPALFHIVKADPLRVYVRIPQYYAARFVSNMTASIEFAERPGKTYPVKLLQTANAIDSTTRTLLAQFILANSDYQILPGGYTQIRLTVKTPDNFILLPSNTLLFNGKGLQVAVVEKNNTVLLKSIEISRDFGKTIEISLGVREGEQVIVDPPDSIFNGQEVRVVKPLPETKNEKI